MCAKEDSLPKGFLIFSFTCISYFPLLQETIWVEWPLITLRTPTSFYLKEYVKGMALVFKKCNTNKKGELSLKKGNNNRKTCKLISLFDCQSFPPC